MGPGRPRSRYIRTYLFNLISCSEFFQKKVFCRFLKDTDIIRMRLSGGLSKGDSNPCGGPGFSRENNTLLSNGKADPFKEKVLLRSQTIW